MGKIICITGASSGLGLDMTRQLHEEGHDLIVTVRKATDEQSLYERFGKERLTVVRMDISTDSEVENAAEEIMKALGDHPLDVLINNAGIVAPGPIMYLPIGELRNQFEVNVFGLIHFTQKLLPAISRSSNAAIINISSVSGLITSPFTAAYSASKFALEALSDGMRRELKPFGVKVVVVEPGPVKTPIWSKNTSVSEKYLDTPYAPLLKQAQKVIENTEKDAIPPSRVSDVISKIVSSRKPKTRYIVAKRAWVYWLFSRVIPDTWLDKLLVRDRLDESSRTRPF